MAPPARQSGGDGVGYQGLEHQNGDPYRLAGTVGNTVNVVTDAAGGPFSKALLQPVLAVEDLRRAADGSGRRGYALRISPVGR